MSWPVLPSFGFAADGVSQSWFKFVAYWGYFDPISQRWTRVDVSKNLLKRVNKEGNYTVVCTDEFMGTEPAPNSPPKVLAMAFISGVLLGQFNKAVILDYGTVYNMNGTILPATYIGFPLQ